ncbi:MAG: dihydroneopterin aldolase family protein [Nitrososphaerota archaeon]
MSKDPARIYFSPKMTERERAVFEAGIALSTIFNLLHGMPVPRDRKAARILERAMEEVIKTQPYRREVRIKIRHRVRRGIYGYDVARGENIYASVKVKYGSAEVTGELRWIKRLRYPLMYIKEIKNKY